jgi:hypothetical protein
LNQEAVPSTSLSAICTIQIRNYFNNQYGRLLHPTKQKQGLELLFSVLTAINQSECEKFWFLQGTESHRWNHGKCRRHHHQTSERPLILIFQSDSTSAGTSARTKGKSLKRSATAHRSEEEDDAMDQDDVEVQAEEEDEDEEDSDYEDGDEEDEDSSDEDEEDEEDEDGSDEDEEDHHVRAPADNEKIQVGSASKVNIFVLNARTLTHLTRPRRASIRRRNRQPR